MEQVCCCVSCGKYYNQVTKTWFTGIDTGEAKIRNVWCPQCIEGIIQK